MQEVFNFLHVHILNGYFTVMLSYLFMMVSTLAGVLSNPVMVMK